MPICYLYSPNPMISDSFISVVPLEKESDHKLSQLFQTEFTGEYVCNSRPRSAEIENSSALVKWVVEKPPPAEKLTVRDAFIKWIVKATYLFMLMSFLHLR